MPALLQGAFGDVDEVRNGSSLETCNNVCWREFRLLRNELRYSGFQATERKREIFLLPERCREWHGF